MNLKKIVTTAAIAGALTMSATVASANNGAFADFNAHYTNAATCTSCHTNTVKPVTPRTALGNDWVTNGGSANAGPTTAAGWDALDAKYLNTYGPVKSTWVAPSASAPSSGGGGCVTSSLTTPLMMVLAMLSLGFFVRRKKD